MNDYTTVGPWQFRLRTLLLAVTGVAVGISLVFGVLKFATVAVLDGGVPVTVQVTPASGRRLQSIGYVPAPTLAHAESYWREFASGGGMVATEFEPALDFNGRQFQAWAPCSSTINAWGWETSYRELGALVLHVAYEDGRHEFVVVKIPPGRGPRNAAVTLP